jgi:hypothetical protein
VQVGAALVAAPPRAPDKTGVELLDELAAFYASWLSADADVITVMTVWTAHTHFVEKFRSRAAGCG